MSGQATSFPGLHGPHPRRTQSDSSILHPDHRVTKLISSEFERSSPKCGHCQASRTNTTAS
jgi:hypothetical protein